VWGRAVGGRWSFEACTASLTRGSSRALRRMLHGTAGSTTPLTLVLNVDLDKRLQGPKS
jgi:hypothetical protein